MDYKENSAMGATNSTPTVKAEPQDTRIAPLADSLLRKYAKNATTARINVKPELSDAARVFIDRDLPVPSYLKKNTIASPDTKFQLDNLQDVKMGDATATSRSKILADEPVTRDYTIFSSSSDIPYVPEDALAQGLRMVKTLKANVKKLELGNKMRKEVWLREIESLGNNAAPTTMIAICGATGAGKSSLLNAILDDNIVPTSGMRACTAVVTEIAYHNKKTIDADVAFLSEAEWKEELAILLEDLVDEDGNLKRSTDMRSDAGVAWSKVHAVYPNITQEQLIRMNADQIVGRDQNIARMLGTTTKIVAKDSKVFAEQIGKYIDSKDQKRGKKDKKDKKDKDKPKPSAGSFGEYFSKEKQEEAQRKEKASKDDGPALWPLIRQVNVRCPCKALSSGAILVDLPGVADANAARNSIAKDYMKKCDCIWILAPIQRAVDDKTARDLLGDAFKMQLMNGNYDATAITFIASKCDDISCSEVIRSLHLDDDPELEEIEERIEQYKDETKEMKQKKSEIEKRIKGIDAGLKDVRAHAKEYRAHLDALQNGKSFIPKLTSKGKQAQAKASSKKRKRGGNGNGKKNSPKRRKSSVQEDEDDEMLDPENDSDESDDHDSDDNSEDEESDEESDSDGASSDADSESETDPEDESSEAEEEETVDSIKEKIKGTKDAIKEGRELLSAARKERKETIDALAGLKKKQVKVQTEKNAFCAKKRSEFSRDVLKEDFRVGLKDLDDSAAEERDPVTFDPTVNLRNYDEIDLPVFTCSARDYVRIKGQVQGDGDPSCFSNLDDTCIPALQEWCHSLTVSSRERAARNFLTHLKTFGSSVQTYVQGIGEITVEDRTLLREKWESTPAHADDDGSAYGGGWASSDDPYDMPGFAQLAGHGLLSMNKPALKVDAYGEPIGVTPQLTKDFKKVVNDSVVNLKTAFNSGLEERCRVGAANAANAAVSTTDEFAASMHWGTFRATLRRFGSFRRDFNVELVNPFTRNIASSWQQVFEGDLFAAFERAATHSINKLLKQVEDSAAGGLKDRVKSQAELCLEEARVALEKTLELVRVTMNNEQKEVSRCLAPHVQNQLTDTYLLALEERGPGSVARQKAVFRNSISEQKDEVFEDGADVILERLAAAAEAIGATLQGALADLAQKIEVNLSVLWEDVQDDPNQVRARQEAVVIISEILQQVHFWTEAAQQRAQTH